jgi:hypothetical protein
MDNIGEMLNEGLEQLYETKNNDWTKVNQTIKLLYSFDVIGIKTIEDIEALKAYTKDHSEELPTKICATIIRLLLDDFNIRDMEPAPVTWNELKHILNGIDFPIDDSL